MMAWLLDTNAIIALVTRRSDALLRRVEAAEPGTLATSSVVAHELYFGAYRSQKIEFNLETLRLLFADLVVLEFDREDARTSGEIRAALARQGPPIGPYDVLIAGQAKARSLTLVTNNLSEFQRIDGLEIEDWTQP
ncbi:MAG: type II toxin-antitoxin system VapC family toxin [Reyranella sp.]